ncbi:MAG: glycosyltransferase [Bacteroidia bacterium]|nr:glycosyltransferase [Bacteroidia bacterium]MDW8015678.1 glycosyltransferase [Bacteroidia bacterium]
MRVLYLTYDGLLDPLGRSQILPYLYGIQDRIGIEYHIISFEKAFRRNEEPALRKELQQRGIKWYPYSFTSQPPLLAKAYDNWRFHWAAHQLYRRQLIHLVHARSYVGGWVAHQLHKKYGVPWIFDMRGFWPDERREMGRWPPQNPFFEWLYRRWKRYERLMLESAAHVIVLTEAAKEVLLEWGLRDSKITVIPCVADYAHFVPQPSHTSQEKRAELGIPQDTFVLGYVGSIGPIYALEEMLRLFKVLLEMLPQSYMVFLTPAPEADILHAASQLGLPLERLRIRFFPRAQLPQWMGILDASVMFRKPGFSTKGCSPTRIPELLAMNIPIITQRELGDNERFKDRLEGLFLCENFSETAYRKAIQALLAAKAQGRFCSIRAQSESFLSLPVGLRHYEEAYRRLMRTPMLASNSQIELQTQ